MTEFIENFTIVKHMGIQGTSRTYEKELFAVYLFYSVPKFASVLPFTFLVDIQKLSCVNLSLWFQIFSIAID